jgi:hypothetical protein
MRQNKEKKTECKDDERASATPSIRKAGAESWHWVTTLLRSISTSKYNFAESNMRQDK